MKGVLNLGLRLMIIALIAGLCLAGTNAITEDAIAQQALEKANAARRSVMPEAEAFELYEELDNQRGVQNAYLCAQGYVLTVVSDGYGSDGVMVTVGILNDGTLNAISVDASGETVGLGAKAGNAAYTDQYIGKTADTLSQVNTITGATVTSKGVMHAVEQAYAYYRANFAQ